MVAAWSTPKDELCIKKVMIMADHIGITLRADLRFSTCSTVHKFHELVLLASLFALPAWLLTMQALFKNLEEFIF